VVEGVYENSVLLNWSQKKPIYGQRQRSDDLVSQGNFLGGVPISHDPPIIGYETVFSKEVLVVNYPTRGIAEGEKLDIYAVQVGTTNFSGKTIELWDAGLTPEKIEQMKEEEAKAQALEAKAQALIEKQKAEAEKAARAKVYAAQARAVILLQSQATNGSASAQCSLGLRYLNGQGCETNREQAIYWLTQAANQGDQEASNKLASLQK